MTPNNNQLISVMKHHHVSSDGAEHSAPIINQLDLDDTRVLVEVMCPQCGDTAFAMTKKHWLAP